MTPMPSGGKVLMQDKEKLLELADMITSGKELDTRQKIERSKASASFIDAPSRQSAGKRPRGGIAQASDKLRDAKELLLARKARRKREKTRARKREEHDSKKDRGSNRNLVDDAMPRRKRVSFV